MESSNNFRFPPFDDTGHPTGSNRSDDSPLSSFAPPRSPGRNRLSSVQLMAWALANWGYQVPDGSIYRAEAVKLYQADMHERIEALFSDLDAQNARICAALRPAA